MQKKLTGRLLALAFVLALLGAASASYAFDVEIAVAPNTFQLGADQGEYVTVHVGIPFGDVSPGSVTLNGIAVESAFADCRGEYVGKFPFAEITPTLEPPVTLMTIVGESSWGEEFAGSREVQVKDWAGGR